MDDEQIAQKLIEYRAGDAYARGKVEILDELARFVEVSDLDRYQLMGLSPNLLGIVYRLVKRARGERSRG